MSGLNENGSKPMALMRITYSRTGKCSKYSINQPCKRLFTSSAQQTWTYKKWDQNSAGLYT